MSSRTLKALAAASLVLAVMIAVSACSGGSQRAAGRHKLDLKLGGLVPLSGTEEAFGATGKKASNLAIEEIRQGDQGD